MQSSRKKNSVYIGSKIPLNQKIILENAIGNGDYLNLSGFVRDAVKEKLAREGLLSSIKPVREVLKL
jgi:Arc/MetJ-type ribon-helix-helix transcriptional regulator